jgi:lysine 6-dehydrogenase
MRFLVIGAGLQGSAAAFDLLRRPATKSVTIVDRDVAQAPSFLDPWRGRNLEFVRLDLNDGPAVQAQVAHVDCVCCAAPYFFNATLTKLAIEAGKHFCDLGGNTDIVFQQKAMHDHAVRKGVSVVPDCGVAPGMVNILAGEGIRRLDQADAVRIYVGGLPQQPEPPLNYMVVYSLEGCLDYYTGRSWVLRNGKRTQVDALSEIESVEFPAPWGTLEAFHTAGGISMMPFTWEGKVRTMEYKTLRYPGHVAIMKPIRDLGLISNEPIEVDGVKVRPRSVFIAATAPVLVKPHALDLVALQVEVTGTRGGKAAGTRWQMVDLYDEEHDVTAMMRTTGYSLAITGIMQLDGRIPKPGVFTPDEIVPAQAMIDELAKRGIILRETTL